MSLIKAFKFHEKVFIKYKKPTGRSKVLCVCEVITSNNHKLDFTLSPNEVLDGHILNGTPKSLKLYRTNENSKSIWKKPNDGFVDPITYPPVEEELTELGYELYRDWQEEIKASGLSREQYLIKLRGHEKYYKKT